MKIEEWREEIDSIDREILRLINKRARMALEVGSLKIKENLPIYDRTREQKVIENLCAENEGPLSCDAVIRIFRRLIQETRTLETTAVTSLHKKEIN